MVGPVDFIETHDIQSDVTLHAILVPKGIARNVRRKPYQNTHHEQMTQFSLLPHSDI